MRVYFFDGKFFNIAIDLQPYGEEAVRCHESGSPDPVRGLLVDVIKNSRSIDRLKPSSLLKLLIYRINKLIHRINDRRDEAGFYLFGQSLSKKMVGPFAGEDYHIQGIIPVCTLQMGNNFP